MKMNTLSSFYSLPRIPHRQRGVGLLEVMIAVLVLGVGVLGVLALQTVALRNTDSSAMSSQATVQVYAMFDLLRANNNKKEGGTGIPLAFQTDWASGSGSSNPEIGTLDHWLTSLQETLGSDAEGMVKCEAGIYGMKFPKDAPAGIATDTNKNAKCIVGVRWNDSRAEGEDKQRPIEIEILL